MLPCQCIDGVNVAVFIAFLKCLRVGASHVILLIDRRPAHTARKATAFVESLNGSPRPIYLPPYPPIATPMRSRKASEGRQRWPHGDRGRRCGVVHAQSKLDSRLGNLP